MFASKQPPEPRPAFHPKKGGMPGKDREEKIELSKRF